MTIIGKKLRGELELDVELVAAKNELTWNIDQDSTSQGIAYRVARHGSILLLSPLLSPKLQESRASMQ